MDTYADDLAELVRALDLHDAIHMGHSTGGGEVARYIGRHGAVRVARAVLIGAIPPLMLQTAGNPGGLPIKAFDDIWANRPGSKVSQGLRDSLWMQGSPRRILLGPQEVRYPNPDCSFHGDDDQIVPIGASALRF